MKLARSSYTILPKAIAPRIGAFRRENYIRYYEVAYCRITVYDIAWASRSIYKGVQAPFHKEAVFSLFHNFGINLSFQGLNIFCYCEPPSHLLRGSGDLPSTLLLTIVTARLTPYVYSS